MSADPMPGNPRPQKDSEEERVQDRVQEGRAERVAQVWMDLQRQEYLEDRSLGLSPEQKRQKRSVEEAWKSVVREEVRARGGDVGSEQELKQMDNTIRDMVHEGSMDSINKGKHSKEGRIECIRASVKRWIKNPALAEKLVAARKQQRQRQRQRQEQRQEQRQGRGKGTRIAMGPTGRVRRIYQGQKRYVARGKRLSNGDIKYKFPSGKVGGLESLTVSKKGKVKVTGKFNGAIYFPRVGKDGKATNPPQYNMVKYVNGKAASVSGPRRPIRGSRPTLDLKDMIKQRDATRKSLSRQRTQTRVHTQGKPGADLADRLTRGAKRDMGASRTMAAPRTPVVAQGKGGRAAGR